jgi:hypothetical protein
MKYPPTAVQVSTADVNYFISDLNDVDVSGEAILCGPGSDGVVCRNCVMEAKHDVSSL